MQIRNARDEERFEKKMLRFCETAPSLVPDDPAPDMPVTTDMQSFLLGIPTVVVGFRDHKGMLWVRLTHSNAGSATPLLTCGFLFTQQHQEFSTLEMPRLVRGKVSWSLLMSTFDERSH